MVKYSGADWVKECITDKISPIGEEVAGFLGTIFKGIYHIDNNSLKKVDWTNTMYIEITIQGSMQTYDSSMLTELVWLSHKMMLRVEISGQAYGYLRLMFHKRNKREGHLYERMPTLENHVEQLEKWHEREE